MAPSLMMSIQQASLTGFVAALLLIPATTGAERPAMRAFTSVDGLAHDRITSIMADAHGFVWFGTAGGLSRFDGSRFASYGAANGLATASITAMIEACDDYFIGTNGGGVGWYRPQAAAAAASRVRMFVVDATLAAANRVNVLWRDRGGRVWAGTDGGLFMLEATGTTLTFTREALGAPEIDEARVQVWSIADDANGRLWIGTSHGLSRRAADGTTVHTTVSPAQGADQVRALVFDPDSGGVWAGHDAGLYFVETDPGMPSSRPRAVRRFTSDNGLPADRIRVLHRAADGTVWIGTDLGVATLQDGRIDIAVPSLAVAWIAEDSRAHLWLGVISGGAVRLSTRGLSTFSTDDGLPSPYVVRTFETRDGRLGVVTRAFALSLLEGDRFTSTRPNVPDRLDAIGRAWRGTLFQDSRGDWWMPSGDGVYRFADVERPEDLARVEPAAFYTSQDGLSGGNIWRFFEDSRGDIWMSTRAPGRDALTRWDHRTGRFQRYGTADGLSAYHAIGAMAEDAAGQLWVGFWDGGAARLRGGRFERVPGLTEPVTAWHRSASGVLWAATLGRGLLRFERPEVESMAFTAMGLADGLRSVRILCIAADTHGRLFLGTTAGVTRFDPADGSMRTYTTEDGLARAEVRHAYRDRSGALWFATDAGVSRLRPDQLDDVTPPRLLIAGARVNGAPLPIPDLGDSTAGPFDLGVGQRYIEIDYMALGDAPSSDLQYRLEGADNDWTPAGNRRSVHYARLASGSYRFVVRSPGDAGAAQASIAFTIRPPVYARWWFVALCSGLAIGLAVAGHRLRVARLIEVERLRTRIASDLHDDIGTNLSQIAILGEVLKRSPGEAATSTSLDRIADLSRESVDALSDIVWSIDPEKDRLGNLVMRMRRLANDLLSSRDIEVIFDMHGSPDLAIGAGVRRDVFLSFKETLHNVVRHAGCRRVTIDVRLEAGRLAVTVRDDGRGFRERHTDGHGLSSLRRRAARLGGAVHIQSSPAAGTTVALTVPQASARTGRRTPPGEPT